VAHVVAFQRWYWCVMLAVATGCGAPPRAHEPARTAPVTRAASAGQCVIAPAATLAVTSPAAPSRDSLMIAIADPAIRTPAPNSREPGSAPVFDQSAAIAPTVECGQVHAAVLARIWRSDSAGARWRIAAPRHDLAATGPNVLRLSPPPGDSAPVLIVQAIEPRVGRDALDAGADVLVTSDPDAVAYARSRPDLESAPLAWDRTWVLVVPSAPPHQPPLGADSAADSLRAALAAGAVREDARASSGAQWWNDAPPSCIAAVMLPPDSGAASVATGDRIAYREGDTVARELAERLVALAAAGSPALAALAPSLAGRSRLRATAVARDAFAHAMATGRDAGYVLPLPLRAPTACQPTDGPSTDSPAHGAAAGSRSIITLVDTRTHVIVRRGGMGLAVDSLGAFTLLAPAPDRP
jgi:hypothetical protein